MFRSEESVASREAEPSDAIWQACLSCVTSILPIVLADGHCQLATALSWTGSS